MEEKGRLIRRVMKLMIRKRISVRRMEERKGARGNSVNRTGGRNK